MVARPATTMRIRPSAVGGTPLGQGAAPALCTPLVGRARDDVLGELVSVLPREPDPIKWRVDYFGGIADIKLVITTAQAMKAASRGVPTLFTRRSANEGGERVPIAESAVVRAVCRYGYGLTANGAHSKQRIRRHDDYH